MLLDNEESHTLLLVEGSVPLGRSLHETLLEVPIRSRSSALSYKKGIALLVHGYIQTRILVVRDRFAGT
jgi:hypothetical protein